MSSVGPFVTQFEEALKKETGASYALAISSGTCALHLALVTVQVRPGDIVIIPSFTFIATANAVRHCGAIPWIVDVSEKDWNLDATLLEKILESDTFYKEGTLFHKATQRRVGAIVPVYALGLPADMENIDRLAKKYNLPVVVDAAAAIGATYGNAKIGSTNSDLIVFSFNGNKTITCGGGGAIVGHRQDLMERARHLSTTARVGPDYDHDVVGYNYRMTNIEAAVGCAQLEQLETFIQRKKYIREFYNQHFKTIKNVTLFPQSQRYESSCWLSGIFLPEGRVKEVISFLRENSIESRLFWKPIHQQAPYKDYPQTKQDVSERIWDKILILPSSSSITDNELMYVKDTLMKYMESSYVP